MRVTCRLLALVALAALLAPAAHASLRAGLAAALHRPPLDARRVGAIAVDLATGRVVFAQNPWLSLAPASNEKLAVTYAVLKTLGPGFRIRTEVRGEGFLDGQVWRGSLILKGYGDPTLDRWALADLARQVRALGIHVVTGSLVGDESWFDAHRAAPGWRSGFEVQESRPLSALVVDRGPVTFKPALVATSLFRTALRRAGVRVFGSSKVVRAGGFPLATHLSVPLEEIVRAMDLESDNFTAEMLLKELGATLEGAGTTAAGAALVREALAAGRVPLAGVSIVDGSGLSMLDRLTAKAIVTILQRFWADPDLRPIVFGALPVAGRSGTLRKRMSKPPARGNVRAKTGTTDEASALSGYVRKRFAFSLLLNGSPVPWLSARAAEDRFATLLAAQ
jgi:D-alanyl-D-alanine carboxypeptidase/D-alanyl-D-alanine-endopeptidase (penicillin-binding protein 4)